MVEKKFFDLKEAKSIAHKYFEKTDFPEDCRQLLEHIDSRYDYIFDVLEYDIYAGDI